MRGLLLTACIADCPFGGYDDLSKRNYHCRDRQTNQQLVVDPSDFLYQEWSVSEITIPGCVAVCVCRG